MPPSGRTPAGTIEGRPACGGARRHRWPAGAAAIVVIALAAAGCSGGSAKSVSATATTTTTTAAPAGTRGGQAFTQCMKSHGVTITGLRGLRAGSTSTTLPPGVTAAQFQQALQACRSQLPVGGNFQNNPAFAAYRNCLKLHGVTLPQPGQGAGGSSTSSSVPGGQGFGGLDRTNPTVQAALQACAALRPTGFGGSTTTTAPAA